MNLERCLIEMVPFALRSFRADDFIDWIFPTRRARDTEVESIMKPKNSSFWVGIIVDFSKLIRKPSDSRREITCFVWFRQSMYVPAAMSRSSR